MEDHKLDAILFPSTAGAAIAARRLSSVQLPAGFVGGPLGASGALPPPEIPYGATFTGRAWSEGSCCGLA